MEINKVYFGDCMDLAKTVPDDYVDLIVTSPPYADTLSYGKEIPVFHPDNYPEWFLQFAIEASRFLKPAGSFILNINDKIINGKRSIYVYKLLCLIEEQTGLSLHDRYVWTQKNGLPTGGPRRLNDKMEYIFHFCRKKKRARGEGYTQQNEHFKSNIDEVREPYAEVTLNRYKTPVGVNDLVEDDGVVESRTKKVAANPKGKIPNTIFSFDNCSAMRNKPANKHPSPFHPDLPRWFIRWLTDAGDVVLDPFMGSGTTAGVCQEMGRNWVGFELNESYSALQEQTLAINPIKTTTYEINEEKP